MCSRHSLTGLLRVHSKPLTQCREHLEAPMDTHLDDLVVDAAARFEVITPSRVVVSPKVILTSGGQSYPGCGTRGDGYEFARRFGHTIVPPRPALVPVTVDAPWVADLRGLTLDDVAVTVLEG